MTPDKPPKVDPIISDGLTFFQPFKYDYVTPQVGHNMTLSGTAPTLTTVDGVPCVHFDGSQILYDQGTANYWDTEASAPSMTVSFWVKINEALPSGKDCMLMNVANQVNNGIAVDLDNRSTRVRFTYSGTFYADLNNLEVNTWYCMAFTLNGTSMTVYSNGAYVTSSNGASPHHKWPNLGIMCLCSDSEVHQVGTVPVDFAGCRIYNRALSAAEIALLATEYTPTVTPIFNYQSLTFDNDTGAAMKTLTFDSKGRTYGFSITSGSLPTGVTFDGLSGTFTYDGTTIEQDQDYPMTIAMSGEFLNTVSADVTVQMKVEGGSIPTSGMVFYAPMTSTAATADTGQSLTYSGTPTATTVDGISCLQFNGSSYLYTTDTTGLSTGSFPFTMSVWVRNTSTSYTTSRKAFFVGKASLNQGISVGVSNVGTWMYGGYLPDIKVGTSDTDTWHHMLETYDGTQYKCYLDGVLINTTSYSNLNAVYGGIYVGCLQDLSEKWIGYIAAARFYDRALGNDEIQALANEFTPIPTNGMVFYAPMTSNAATAETGQALSYNGTPTATTVDGINCLNCNNAQITTTDLAAFPSGNQSFTFSCWAKLVDLSYNYSLVVLGTNRAYDYAHMGVGQSNIWFNFITDSYTLNNQTLPTTWFNMLGTYDGTTRERVIYIDGVEVGRNTLNADADITHGSFIINFDKNNRKDTYLAACRVYNRVLTSSEIQVLVTEFTPST